MTKKFNSVTIINSEPIYNRHGIVILEDTVKFADGTTYSYVYFKSRGTVVVIAVTRNRKIVVTKQYRHPLRRIVYEIPGGAVEDNETPLQAALRELEEETGFIAKKI